MVVSVKQKSDQLKCKHIFLKNENFIDYMISNNSKKRILAVGAKEQKNSDQRKNNSMYNKIEEKLMAIR